MSKTFPAPSPLDNLGANAPSGVAGSFGNVAGVTSIDSSVRRFNVEISDDRLIDLQTRIATARLPERETVFDRSQGVPLAMMKNLLRYWENEYDWRRVEARLNSYPSFITEIDGLDIHFIHVRSEHKGSLPLILTHGWPGSMVEMLKIIDPLTNPTLYDGTAKDAFDVVIPSMPGYGFSGKPKASGWDTRKIAKAWNELMKRLGYTEYAAQGGGWGALVVDQMGVQAPAELIGIHTNMAGAVPVNVSRAAAVGAAASAALSAEERFAYDQLVVAYQNLHSTRYMGARPQTLLGLSDSPAALASFLLDHDKLNLELIIRTLDGKHEGLTKDDLLDNITLVWLTNSGVSGARLFWENDLSFFEPKGVKIPVAVSAFPNEFFQVPRSWAQAAYGNLIYFNKVEKGGHFAAWEQPELFTSELRSAFRSLRSTQ